MMKRLQSLLPVAATCSVLLLSGAAPLKAQFGLFKHSSSPSYQTYKDAAGRFTLDYPAKDWRVINGGGSILVGFTQKDGEASVLVDYMKMQLSLAPDEIGETFADLELRLLKERQPAILDAASGVEKAKAGPRVVIHFVSPGKKEQVVQYSIPLGADLYRLVCTTRVDRAEKNQPIFTHIVDSFAAK